MYESDQRWSDAARERRYALNITPDDPTQMFRLGMDLLQVGLTQEANATFRRALEISPRETRAYYGLGIAATGLGDVSAARDAFTRFLALAPSRDSALAADTRRRLEELAP
jgi:Flp pilus assembly protein TadD